MFFCLEEKISDVLDDLDVFDDQNAEGDCRDAKFQKSNAGEMRIQRASQPINLSPLSGVQG